MIDATAVALATGDLLDGKYRIHSRLGEGGMGAVYRATHLGTTRTVAIKVIQPRLSNRPEFVARFHREAEAAGRLRHPNVVDVTDFGVTHIPGGRVAYLVMEFLDGCTLADVLAEEHRLPVSWVVDILEQVCSALDEAHEQGMVHRDLKPDNIWLEPNMRRGYTVKVLDFGLVRFDTPPATTTPAPGGLIGNESTRATPAERPAHLQTVAAESRTPTPATALLDADATRLSDSNSQSEALALTQVGSTMGTPFYMSPEQCRGESVDARSDVYSLGVIAYRMLAGEPPFTGPGHEVMALHRSAAPRPLRELNPRVPHGVAEVVMGALSKDPAARPRTAGGFAAALSAAAENSGALLRQAASLYSERFPLFLRVSCAAYLPLIAIVGLLALADRTQWFSYSVAMLLLLAMVAANLGAYFVTSAAVVPVVVQAIVAPLQVIPARAAWIALRRRWFPFALATVLVVTGTLLGSLFLLVPGLLFALGHALYAPVIIIEGLPVGAALRRARALARRARSTVLIIAVLQFALPIMVWIASVDFNVTLNLDEHWQPHEFGFGFATSGDVVLYQLINVVITPLTGIMTALLYLKTRHASGESLREAAERLAGVDVPRSRWQMRMRQGHSRTASKPASLSSPAPGDTQGATGPGPIR
jgi:serine/threonine protein kinase